MTQDRLKYAVNLHDNILLLKRNLAELKKIKEQIKGESHSGLNLHFVNVDSQRDSFSVNSELMKSIVNMILESWENEIILKVKEFEEL